MASSEGLLRKAPEVDDPGVRQKLLVSHTITRLGTQGWMFCAPLILLRFTPGSLAGPACWGMVTMVASLFLGPPLGTWADRSDRAKVVKTGVLMQAAAVLGATLALVWVSATSEDNGEMNYLAVGVFTLFGVVEKLGTVLSDVAVKREWAPCLFSKGDQLSRVNRWMSQIDLVSETVGPLAAGLLMTLGTYQNGEVARSLLPRCISSDDFGFVAVGALNWLSFWPQLGLLLSVYRSHASFLQPQDREARKVNLPQAGAWCNWLRHPGGLPLLSLSYALLYLTVLSPHGALLTAFLLMYGVPSWELSLLRGTGAFLGVLGVTLRPAMGRGMGERRADAFSVVWLAIFMVVALVSYWETREADSVWKQALLVVFMGAVCLGRPGLYAFELGVLNTEQQIADKRYRSAIGAVDNALTSGATVIMYGSGMVWTRPAQFWLLVCGSAAFVTAGALVYIIWMALFQAIRHKHNLSEEHGHSHGHGGEGHAHDGHAHHSHTLQEEEELTDSPDGFHEHFAYAPKTCSMQ